MISNQGLGPSRAGSTRRAPPLWRPSLASLAWLATSVTLSASLAGCAAFTSAGLPVGTPIAQVRQSWLTPTGEHALPDGGTRLEFARGAFGRETYMLDFDAQGRLFRSQQVLTEENFASIVPGMTGQEVLRQLGRPAHVFNVGRQNLQVWNYRFFGGDCFWFQVSIANADQRVTAAGNGYDPACNGPLNRE